MEFFQTKKNISLKNFFSKGGEVFFIWEYLKIFQYFDGIIRVTNFCYSKTISIFRILLKTKIMLYKTLYLSTQTKEKIITKMKVKNTT